MGPGCTRASLPAPGDRQPITKESPDGVQQQRRTTRGHQESGVEYVDIRFCDLPGVMQHFSIPASAFTEDVFEEGLAFDGSSVRGFQSIDESDMMLLPDPATARIDPFRKAKTMNPELLRPRPVHAKPTAATRVTSPARPRITWPPPASPTPASSVPRPSSTSSTRCRSTRR